MSELAGPPVPGLAKLWTHDPVTAGPYRLVGRLGAGGQGVVYLGEDDAASASGTMSAAPRRSCSPASAPSPPAG
ncbi:hypothetical protein ACIA47_16835 [Micromonospora sp. NPDC051227]|uniref:hypothetical protein n=1 Tax=Micromonospora sp. NPDC051227 TaxID=3364285 RepID=UPI0037A15391